MDLERDLKHAGNPVAPAGESNDIKTAAKKEETHSDGNLDALDTPMLPQKTEAPISRDPYSIAEPTCAVCWENLAGKGQLLRDGKAYCLRPGCGYPSREVRPVEVIQICYASAESTAEPSVYSDQIEEVS